MHPFGIPAQLLDIGHQVVAESDRLRDLQMSESWHDGIDMLLCKVDKSILKPNEPVLRLINALAQPQSEVGGHLVISRATRMKALSGITHQGGQSGFDVEMNILKINRPLELSPSDLLADQSHAALNICQITAGQNPARMKHAGMCE
jgi:hypothetical protein